RSEITEASIMVFFQILYILQRSWFYSLWYEILLEEDNSWNLNKEEMKNNCLTWVTSGGVHALTVKILDILILIVINNFAEYGIVLIQSLTEHKFGQELHLSK
ncbi:hypothetical protein ACJX0J_013083, partial [Zea mays]